MKYWLGLFAIVGCMTLGVWVASGPGRERARFQQVRGGMTMEEVLEVVGTDIPEADTHYSSPPIWVHGAPSPEVDLHTRRIVSWASKWNKHRRFQVILDQHDRVIQAQETNDR
jgi:hypothetical protein